MEGEAESFEQVKPTVDNSGENHVGKQGSVERAEFLGEKPLQNDAGAVNFLASASCSQGIATAGLNATGFNPSQLTIFYGGKVCVFDPIPAEKAQEIIFIAATATAAATNSHDMKNSAVDSPTSSPVLTRSLSLQSSATLPQASPGPQSYPLHRPSLCKLQAELPIARRHSLQRFFEKRRDRLVNRNPYCTSSMAKMADDTKMETSPDSSCTEKSHFPQEECQPKVAAHQL